MLRTMLKSKIHRATVTQADLNGAAALLVHVGDLVILIAYGLVEDAEAKAVEPRVVFVDERNRVLTTGGDPADAGPAEGPGELRRGDLVA